jgi:hypothetical protein
MPDRDTPPDHDGMFATLQQDLPVVCHNETERIRYFRTIAGDVPISEDVFRRYTPMKASNFVGATATEIVNAGEKRRLAFAIEEAKYIVNQLEATLRNPVATETEKQIASDMLAHYREIGQ